MGAFVAFLPSNHLKSKLEFLLFIAKNMNHGYHIGVDVCLQQLEEMKGCLYASKWGRDTITTALVTTLSPVSDTIVYYIQSSNELNINYRIWNTNKGQKHSLALKHNQCSCFACRSLGKHGCCIVFRLCTFSFACFNIHILYFGEMSPRISLHV